MPDSFQSRLVRVLAILRLITEEPEAWTRKRLAEHFGMSERMLDNDLRALRASGYDIGHSPRGYYLLSKAPAMSAAAEPVSPWTPDALWILRLRLGLTQAELGERIGVKQARVSQFELGLAVPSTEVVQELDALQASITGGGPLSPDRVPTGGGGPSPACLTE